MTRVFLYKVLGSKKQDQELPDSLESMVRYTAFIMHPAQPSEAKLGRVHFTFCHIQIIFRLLQVELFRGYYVYCMQI